MLPVSTPCLILNPHVDQASDVQVAVSSTAQDHGSCQVGQTAKLLPRCLATGAEFEDSYNFLFDQYPENTGVKECFCSFRPEN